MADEPQSPKEDSESVNLFTVSALRLHRTRLPPTPGTEPSLVQRLRRLVRGLLGRKKEGNP